MDHSKSPTEAAHAWVAFQDLHRQIGEAAYEDARGKKLFNDASIFAKWALHDPELCWATIVEIWNRVGHNDLEVLAVLGAGEVEDLLCNFGDDYFPVIEKFCEVEPEFKTVLRMVWKSSMSAALWEKVQDLRGGPNL